MERVIWTHEKRRLKRVRNWQKSGQNTQTWCRENDISYNYFLTWRKKLTYEPAEIFHEIEYVKEKNPLEIRFQDFSITTPDEFDPQSLLKCLQA